MSEPLPLDLLNTVWIEDGERRDLLLEDGGMSLWPRPLDSMFAETAGAGMHRR